MWVKVIQIYIKMYNIVVFIIRKIWKKSACKCLYTNQR